MSKRSGVTWSVPTKYDSSDGATGDGFGLRLGLSNNDFIVAAANKAYVFKTTCDAFTAPTNGGVGTCTNQLACGSTCQPTCDSGYTVSGTTSCSNSGTLTAATCNAGGGGDNGGGDSGGGGNIGGGGGGGGGTDMMIYVIGGLGITIPVVICMILGIWYK